MSTPAIAGRLSGKIALITGGAGNIGEVITRRYLAEGATVVITGRNEQKLTAYCARLIAEEGVEPDRVVAVRMDGSDADQVRQGVAKLFNQLGRIDILVNNAGSTGARQRLADIPLSREDLRGNDTETLSDGVGNLFGISWNLVRAVAPRMHAGATIINISTILSRTDYYGRIPYVVPKAALNVLGSHLATELGAQGIRVNTIYPGPIESDRIREVFQSMDTLKGVAAGTTAQDFSSMMRLSRDAQDGTLAKGFPAPLDVANAAVFLGSDESAALSGHAIEVTHGMAVPVESRTTFVSSASLRAVDANGQVVLVCAGDQVEDAMALAGVLRSCGAEVALAFRSRSAIAQLELMLRESRRLQGPDYTPPLVLHLDPNEPETFALALALIEEFAGAPNRAIILPAHGTEAFRSSLVTASDEEVHAFMQEEIVGATALAHYLARYWETHSKPPFTLPTFAPRVIFLSNGDDGRGNVYADMLRASIEQLIRVWRHEAELDVARTGGDKPSKPLWAAQVIRYVNNEQVGLDYASAWVAKLLNSARRIEEINLYVPRNIALTTGSQRPDFGWAETLIGLHLGKVALITGGSAGIGGQIGRLLAISGAKVMLAARGADQLDQLQRMVVDELEELGYNDAQARVQIMPDCDVSNETSLGALVELTLDRFGRIDYLINNAGIAGVEEMVIDLPLKGWNHTLQANLISNYSLIRKIAPTMKAQGSGYILNVSSYFGGEKYVAIPYPNRADYAVSKAGQRAMAEVWARFLGPEVQINALAPGPVEGDRLKGSGERPGLFARRGRLILENKRLNEVHSALIQSYRATQRPMIELIGLLTANDVQALADGNEAVVPEPLRRLAATFLSQGDPQASSRTFVLNRSIADKLSRRLTVGGYFTAEQSEITLAALPPDPFFARAQIDREARKVHEGIMRMLYLHRMPTEFDVAIATVYYLADRNVSGETFHPSGGLRLERTSTEGELFGKPDPKQIEKLRGSQVFLIGEYLQSHLIHLARTYIETCGAAHVTLITETETGAHPLLESLADLVSAGRVTNVVAGHDVEGAIDRAIAVVGRPNAVISTPFRALPTRALVGIDDDWTAVLSEQDFADLVAQQLTHHFRITQKVSLLDGAHLVLVTPETSSRSAQEVFGLANFVKTTLQAFTATIGVESERSVHRVPVNQIDLTRRARSEEPRTPADEQFELARFVDAVLLTSSPPLLDTGSYMGRINRGKAITV